MADEREEGELSLDTKRKKRRTVTDEGGEKTDDRNGGFSGC
jgi:hypothetical protein